MPRCAVPSSRTIASARSSTKVGEPCWSLTTLSGPPASARRRIFSTKVLADGPYIQAVLMIR